MVYYEQNFLNAKRGERDLQKVWGYLKSAALRGKPSKLGLFIPNFLYMVELPAAMSNIAYEVGEYEVGLHYTQTALEQLCYWPDSFS